MDADPVSCENYDEALNHDEIPTVTDVSQPDIDSFEMGRKTVDVYQWSDCGLVSSFDGETATRYGCSPGYRNGPRIVMPSRVEC